jgi:diphthamide biosynthesis methyltransferase
MTKENIEKGKIILRNIDTLKEFLYIFNEDYTVLHIAVHRPGKSNISFDMLAILLKSFDVEKYENEIIDNIKQNTIKEIEKLEIEFENL